MAEVVKGFEGLTLQGAYTPDSLAERGKTLRYFFERGDITAEAFATQAILGLQLLSANTPQKFSTLVHGHSYQYFDIRKTLQTEMGELAQVLTDMHAKHIAGVSHAPAVEIDLQTDAENKLSATFRLNSSTQDVSSGAIPIDLLGEASSDRRSLERFLRHKDAARLVREMERGERPTMQAVVYKPDPQLRYEHGYTDYEILFQDTQDPTIPPVRTRLVSLAQALDRITPSSLDSSDVFDRLYAIETTVIDDEKPLNTLMRGLREIALVDGQISRTIDTIHAARDSQRERNRILDLEDQLADWKALHITLGLQLLDRNLHFREQGLPSLNLTAEIAERKSGNGQELRIGSRDERLSGTMQLVFPIPSAQARTPEERTLRMAIGEYVYHVQNPRR